MPVKYWSFAGLMLTYWCNARCASCYLCCGPDRHLEMSAADALAYWRQLIAASPHGCRVHVSGGEPFGNWARLIELCRRAKRAGLGPLEKIETNAFWAIDEGTVRDRLAALDDAGMMKISISADPYHQQFVPLERCRLLARLAEEMLGGSRVQVRWRDWLKDGRDTDRLSPAEREAIFAAWAAAGRDRRVGRGAGLAGGAGKAPGELADKSCRNALLRSKHVHIGPGGTVTPGTCAGIVLGTIGDQSVADIWRKLDADYADRPIVGTLAAKGPAGLLGRAEAAGFVTAERYADKCQLCWEIRKHLVRKGLGGVELAPQWMYAAR